MASRNRYNYQTRLFFLIVVFTWILTFAFFMLQFTREKEYKVETLNQQLQVYNKGLLRAIETDSVRDFAMLDRIVRADSMRVTVVDAAGNVVYDSTGETNLANHSSRHEIQDALANGSGYTIRRQSESTAMDYFYSATKGREFVVRSALPYNSSLYANLKIDSIYIWLIIAMAIVVSVIAYFASRRIGQNIKNLRDFAEQAETGNVLTYDTDSFPQDELGEISRNIVNLYKNLKATAQERDENLKNAIFEEQEKVRIKHQLTNNINHELKTPIGVIKGYLDTICDSPDLDPEVREHFILKARDYANRLAALISDVSAITRLAEGGNMINTENIDFHDFTFQLANEINESGALGHMEFIADIPTETEIRGNANLLHGMLMNLARNSANYSCGTTCIIECNGLTEDGTMYEFSFYDDGVGVPEDSLPHLFERFYRVDTGRSRKNGGTGLGLSLVYNTITGHGGTITCRNREDAGLEIRFTLPRASRRK